MKRIIDNALNSYTTYRSVLYALIAITAVLLVLGFTGDITRSPTGMLISLCTVISIGYITNELAARITSVVSNTESWLITALIVFCIVSPPDSATFGVGAALAILLAITSKYLIVYKGVHIFNPAALGAFAASALGLGYASWWLNGAVTIPAIIFVGLLVARKVRHLQLLGVFIFATAIGIIFAALWHHSSLATIPQYTIVSWPTIFLGSIMLTEPLTMPTRWRDQMLYAVFVGFTGSIGITIGSFTFSPLFSLLCANAITFWLCRRSVGQASFVSRTLLTPKTEEFKFMSDRVLQFEPGQYVELGLPHKAVDNRGIRRCFSIVSQPGTKELRIAVTFPDDSSSYKCQLKNIAKNQHVVIVRIAGTFTLPHDQQRKLLWIAGGIGITPFVSMLQALRSDSTLRDIVLLYVAALPNEFSYAALIKTMSMRGIKTIYIAADAPIEWQGEKGYISSELIARIAPDATSRLAFVSGSPKMVEESVRVLQQSGISSKNIKTDHFSGY